MSESVPIIIEHVVGTLPSDILARRSVLNALILCLGGDATDELRGMLGDLDRHLARQREFNLGDTARGTGRLGDQPLQRGSGRLGDQPIAKGGRK